MENFIQYIGKFHPLLVHLPIGILIAAVLFDFLSKKDKYKTLGASVKMLYFLGTLGASVSCLTGYFLSTSGEYAGSSLQFHQWFGIAVALLGLALYYFRFKGNWSLYFGGLLFILLSVTGHLGGTLTHGEGYLSLKSKDSIRPVLTNVQEADVYKEVIVPILADNCYKCHSDKKQKGQLRLDTPELIAKGGKSGVPIIKAGNSDESELISRLHLPLNDDMHMPPKKGSELSDAQIEILEWWINEGAIYEGKVKSLTQDKTIKHLLEGLESSQLVKKTSSIYPNIDPGPFKLEAIPPLKEVRAVVLPLGQNSNLLGINFVNVEKVSLEIMELLMPLKEHIVWLKLSESSFNDSLVSYLLEMPYLSKLFLDHTAITDQGLEQLVHLDHLYFLNIVGTKTTQKGIERLTQVSTLDQLFIYQTQTTAAEKSQLVSILSPVNVDTGGYIVPTLVVDTTLVHGRD